MKINLLGHKDILQLASGRLKPQGKGGAFCSRLKRQDEMEFKRCTVKSGWQ